MNDQELDERLRRADPAGRAPETLEWTIDQLVTRPLVARPQEWMQHPRPQDIGSPESIQPWAVVEQGLAVLDHVIPGIAWGAATPGESFEPGDPHLASVTQLCRDDLDSLEPGE
ncbi:hypothetical protein KZC51_06220 [Microbacterium sp. SSW1-49]|uniref:Uncharacterized protein n=1 Tax=Microbacterium croceum TaxID=2851645 RepID=A0ABT0FCE6_9MICO|nr:hypothetical protein [Microbacterium croceum]MCK2035728.1 hypothetical protein [Microbacterium croceum]